MHAELLLNADTARHTDGSEPHGLTGSRQAECAAPDAVDPSNLTSHGISDMTTETARGTPAQNIWPAIAPRRADETGMPLTESV